MLVRMRGLERSQDGVWRYRRTVPPRLRSIIGPYQVVRSLGKDEETAKRRYAVAKADVERLFSEAEKAVSNPSVAAYKAVQDWRQHRAAHPVEDDAEDAADLAITERLERNNLDPHERAILEALLRRRDDDGADNPPLSLVFERYYSERKLPPRTRTEWDYVLRRFKETVGADLPVRSVTQAHVRAFKAALLATKRGNGSGGGATVAPKYVQKLLSALRAVLSWAKRQGYVTTNVAEGITQLVTKDDPTDRRLPFTVEQARAILEKLPEKGAMRWLWLIGLYSGARLNEIAGLRREDVKEVDGVLCFHITPHDGRGLKNASSRRMVPVHPAILAAGFTPDVLPFKSDGHYYSKRVNPWLREVVGVADRRLSFHSTRHTFKDRMRAARVPEPEQRAIMGHAGNSVADGYGLGYPMSVLAEAVAKVKY
jgi:integrase